MKGTLTTPKNRLVIWVVAKAIVDKISSIMEEGTGIAKIRKDIGKAAFRTALSPNSSKNEPAQKIRVADVDTVARGPDPISRDPAIRNNPIPAAMAISPGI